MTYYDDAEFAAIRITRLALEEDDMREGGNSEAIREVVEELSGRHGPIAELAITVALARHLGSALHVVASAREGGQTATDVLDQFEQHKLEQHVYEKDNPDDD